MKTLSLLLTLLLFTYLTRAQASKGQPDIKQDEAKVSGNVVTLAGNEPLRKARAQLISMDDRTHSASVITDASGRFEFKHVEAGRYRLQVSRSGFTAQEYGEKKIGGPGAVLSLRPGQEMKDLIFRLVPSAVIAGKIVDEDGEPLASVNVSALREVYSEGKRSLSTFTIASTDDLGQFRLFGLAPGKYFVSALYPRWNRFGGNEEDSDPTQPGEEGYAKLYYPGTPDRAKAASITVKSGEELSSIDILMRQVAVYHVRGHVYNQATQKPGVETNVWLMPKRSGNEWEFSNDQAFVKKKDGSFDIPEVLPGSYILMAAWFDEGKAYSTRMPLEVGNANIDGLSITIGPGIAITGRILWEGKPNLEDADLTVSAKPADGGWNFWGGRAHVTSNNTFTLNNVGDGTYFAETNGQSKDCYIKNVQYGSFDALEEGFTVKGVPATLEITISSRGARIQGAVVDADELPAAGVWVVLVPEPAHRTQRRLYKTATTDQYGHFDLRGIAPGDYKLFSWEESESGSWEDPDFLKPFEDKGERIYLQEGDQKSQNLKAIRTATPQSPKS